MTLYDEIGRNNRITYVLFFLYSLLYGGVILSFILVLGIYPDLPTFLAMSVLVFVVYYFIVFPNGAKIILGSTGATKLKKSDDPYLFNIVEALSIGAGIPTPDIYLIDSEALNAFATGPDPAHSVVAITTGLRKRLNRLELEGVMAHEMSHIRNYDIRLMLTAAIFAFAIALLANLGLNMLRVRSGDRDRGNGILVLIGAVFLILAPIFSLLARLAISRNREYAADASGAMLTRYPDGLASALKKIEKYYEAEHSEMQGVNDATRPLFIFDPQRKALFNLFSTHPPVEDRIKRLEKM